MLDIRLPIGAMFALLGAILVVYGLVTPAEMYRVSLGLNLNLIGGGAMALFGAGMLLWMRWRPEPDSETGELSAVVKAATSEMTADSPR